MKVLLVEDDILIRMFIKRNMMKMGYENLFEASEGAEALEMVDENSPDIVFLDIKVKGEIDGVELARNIRKNTTPHIVLVYMSAYDQSVFDEEEINSLFDYYLAKPVNPDELRALCEKITARVRGYDE
ncbi:MAG: response regulator [Spirochaetia bacterium]|nr:response regulator [Spirochaetia bacterium]